MKRLPFELILAIHYLKPKRTYVSVITLICVIGVMLGVAVLMVVIAVMTGFDQQLRDKLISFNAHIRIEYSNGPLRHWERLIEELDSKPHILGVAPYVIGQVMIKTQPHGAPPRYFVPILRGIDPMYEPKVSQIISSCITGKADLSGYNAIIGKQLADALGVWIGDVLAIYSIRQFEQWDKAREEGKEELPLAAELEIAGIFELGFYEFDSMFIICSLANAQDIFGLTDSVHGLILRLDDPNKAVNVKQNLEHILGPAYRVTTWMEENSTLLEALAVEKHVMFYLLLFITIVAAFGICSALITFVVQKTKEIGTMKALGATNLQIMLVFIIQSLIVGVIGVGLGFIFGMVSLHYRNDVLHMLRRLTGFELFPASIYNFSELPAKIVPTDVVTIVIAALIICLCAGIIPAIQAARLQPVEALRHE